MQSPIIGHTLRNGSRLLHAALVSFHASIVGHHFHPVALARDRGQVLCVLGCDLYEKVAFDSGMIENIDGPEAPDGVASCTTSVGDHFETTRTPA